MSTELLKALTTLQIGERVAMADTEVLGVPGGWIFTTENASGNLTSCFVPLPQNQLAMEQNKIKLHLPH